MIHPLNFPRSGVFRTLFSVCGPVFLAMSPAVAAPRPPNVVILFADDAGYADFGFQQKPDPALAALTPRITGLAREGVVFSQAYVSGAVCSPSRAGAMTGRYQQRFGHEKNIAPGYMKGGLPLSEKFAGDRLRPLGYTTGLIGKWHLGYPEDYQPMKRGFDHFYGLLQGSRGYFPMKKATAHQGIFDDGKPTPEAGYTTDRIGDGACAFIEKNKDKPFYLFVSFTAPHGPLQPKPEVVTALKGFSNEKRRKYAGLVKSLDDNCGRILDTLDKLGLAANTLVIFSNDNGGQTSTGAINTPLRGAKSQVFEGGIRVPMAMRLPGKIKPGSTIDTPVITLDWLPTFVELAGGKPDPAWKLDGLSLVPLISGNPESFPKRSLHWRTNGKTGPIALRDGDWKLINRNKTGAGGPELEIPFLSNFHWTIRVPEANHLPPRAEFSSLQSGRVAQW
jgi:arylsulfatase A-like enzyme